MASPEASTVTLEQMSLGVHPLEQMSAAVLAVEQMSRGVHPLEQMSPAVLAVEQMSLGVPPLEHMSLVVLADELVVGLSVIFSAKAELTGGIELNKTDPLVLSKEAVLIQPLKKFDKVQEGWVTILDKLFGMPAETVDLRQPY